MLSSGHDMAVPLTNSQQLCLPEQDEASQNQQVWGRGPKDPACTEGLLEGHSHASGVLSRPHI